MCGHANTNKENTHQQHHITNPGPIRTAEPATNPAINASQTPIGGFLPRCRYSAPAKGSCTRPLEQASESHSVSTHHPLQRVTRSTTSTPCKSSLPLYGHSAFLVRLGKKNDGLSCRLTSSKGMRPGQMRAGSSIRALVMMSALTLSQGYMSRYVLATCARKTVWLGHDRHCTDTGLNRDQPQIHVQFDRKHQHVGRRKGRRLFLQALRKLHCRL